MPTLSQVAVALALIVGLYLVVRYWFTPLKSSLLRIEDLPDLISPHRSFSVSMNPTRKMRGADHGVQFRDKDTSIIYHTTNNELGHVETVDVFVPRKTGFVITMRNGNVTVFERVGRNPINSPTLNLEQKSALAQFMQSVRGCFDKTTLAKQVDSLI